MVHREVGLAADGQVAIRTIAVGEAGQRKSHGPVGGVFKRHDAVGSVAIADGLEDVWEREERERERVSWRSIS